MISHANMSGVYKGLDCKDADNNFTFGYRRFSILSALINGVILLLGSIFVIYEASQRIMSPEKVSPEGMLGLAILGILVNSFAAYRLSKDDSMNTKMVMFHQFKNFSSTLLAIKKFSHLMLMITLIIHLIKESSNRLRIDL